MHASAVWNSTPLDKSPWTQKLKKKQSIQFIYKTCVSMFSKCLFYFDVINSFLNEDLWESTEVLLVPGKTFWKTTHPHPHIPLLISTYWLMTYSLQDIWIKFEFEQHLTKLLHVGIEVQTAYCISVSLEMPL